MCRNSFDYNDIQQAMLDYEYDCDIRCNRCSHYEEYCTCLSNMDDYHDFVNYDEYQQKTKEILNGNEYLCAYYRTTFENSPLPQILDEIKEKTKNMDNKNRKKYFNKIMKDYVYDLPTGENISDFYNIVLYNFFN